MFSGTFCRETDLKLDGIAKIGQPYSRIGAICLSNSDNAKLTEIFPVSFECVLPHFTLYPQVCV